MVYGLCCLLIYPYVVPSLIMFISLELRIHLSHVPSFFPPAIKMSETKLDNFQNTGYNGDCEMVFTPDSEALLLVGADGFLKVRCIERVPSSSDKVSLLTPFLFIWTQSEVSIQR